MGGHDFPFVVAEPGDSRPYCGGDVSVTAGERAVSNKSHSFWFWFTGVHGMMSGSLVHGEKVVPH